MAVRPRGWPDEAGALLILGKAGGWKGVPVGAAATGGCRAETRSGADDEGAAARVGPGWLEGCALRGFGGRAEGTDRGGLSGGIVR